MPQSASNETHFQLHLSGVHAPRGTTTSTCIWSRSREGAAGWGLSGEHRARLRHRDAMAPRQARAEAATRAAGGRCREVSEELRVSEPQEPEPCRPGTRGSDNMACCLARMMAAARENSNTLTRPKSCMRTRQNRRHSERAVGVAKKSTVQMWFRWSRCGSDVEASCGRPCGEFDGLLLIMVGTRVSFVTHAKLSAWNERYFGSGVGSGFVQS